MPKLVNWNKKEEFKVKEEVPKGAGVKKGIDPEKVKKESFCCKCNEPFDQRQELKIESTGKKVTDSAGPSEGKEAFIAQHKNCKDKSVSHYLIEGPKGFAEVSTTFVK